MWDPFVAMISSLVLLVKMYTKSPLPLAFLVLGWVPVVGFDMVTHVTVDGGFGGFRWVGVLGFLLFWVGLGYRVPFFGLLGGLGCDMWVVAFFLAGVLGVPPWVVVVAEKGSAPPCRLSLLHPHGSGVELRYS